MQSHWPVNAKFVASDIYCTVCPKCRSVQSGNDWPPMPGEAFTCETCGFGYSTEDLRHICSRDVWYYTLCKIEDEHHRRGIPMVPGTDDLQDEYDKELLESRISRGFRDEIAMFVKEKEQ